MFILFELRIISAHGPTISKIRVTIDGNNATVDNFIDQERDFEYESNEQILATVFDNFAESFRTIEDSVIEIVASDEIKEQVEEYLWEYHHEDEISSEISETPLKVVHIVYEGFEEEIYVPDEDDEELDRKS